MGAGKKPKQLVTTERWHSEQSTNWGQAQNITFEPSVLPRALLPGIFFITAVATASWTFEVGPTEPRVTPPPPPPPPTDDKPANRDTVRSPTAVWCDMDDLPTAVWPYWTDRTHSAGSRRKFFLHWQRWMNTTSTLDERRLNEAMR